MNTLFFNISELLSLEGVVKKAGSHLLPDDLSLIRNASVIASEGEILWVGKKEDIPQKLKTTITKEVDCKNKTVTPSFVDSHTHLIFAGKRSHEYFMRLSGASYEDIAAAGGGITYSSQQTNTATKAELYSIAQKRLQDMHSLGVAAVEIKTGYSLKLQGELDLLRIINDLSQFFKKTMLIHRTLLSAHAIAKNHTANSYVETVVLPSIDLAAQEKLVDSVDVFHEQNYFDEHHVNTIFAHAKSYNLQCRLHADELNNNGGAKLASKWKCLSADHLLKTDLEGAQSLASSNTVATLLPGTAFFLGKPLPNAKILIDTGCSVAIASDFNPGSCFNNDLFQIARMSAPTLKLNPAAIWAAITFNGAKAIGASKLGAVIPGFKPNMLLWETHSHEDLLYDWTVRPTCTHL